MNLKTAQLCFIGNILGRNPGYVTTQGLIVSDLLAAEGVRITCVSSKINRALRLAEIVMTLVKNHRKFDAIVLEVYSGMGFIIADVASWLCKRFRLPLVMFLHGGNLPEFITENPRWSRRVLDRADFLVAPSSFLAEKIGNLGYQITVIPNVIDLDLYTFRKRRQIQPRLVWMRSFHSTYHPEMAVEVLAELRQSVPDATLTMAGVDKGLEKKVKELAKKKGLAAAVRFPGFLDAGAKAREFAAADIYLNTNRIDNMPVSVVEACAFGLPVVATAVGGIPYLIEHRKNGLLVPNEDVKAMVEAVKNLIDDPDLTQTISQNARILAELSAWVRVRTAWQELFEKALHSNFSKTESVLMSDKLSAEKLKI